MSANNYRPGLRVLLVALCATALASACSILPEREVVHIWQPPETASVQPAAGADFSLRINTPNVVGMLDQKGIVVMPSPGQISVYKGARWSESPALLVRNRLVDAFMAAGLASVTTDDDRFSADYTLTGSLRGFQSEYRSGAPVVVVRYDAQLRRKETRTVAASHSFVITEQPLGTQVPQVVAAFGAADDALAKQVVAWVLEQTRQGPAAAAAPGDQGSRD